VWLVRANKDVSLNIDSFSSRKSSCNLVFWGATLELKVQSANLIESEFSSSRAAMEAWLPILSLKWLCTTSISEKAVDMPNRSSRERVIYKLTSSNIVVKVTIWNVDFKISFFLELEEDTIWYRLILCEVAICDRKDLSDSWWLCPSKCPYRKCASWVCFVPIEKAVAYFNLLLQAIGINKQCENWSDFSIPSCLIPIRKIYFMSIVDKVGIGNCERIAC